MKEKKNKKEKSKLRLWIENIVQVVIVLVCIVISVITIANPGGVKEDYSKINVSYMPVLSESMSGTFEKGDLIFGDKIERDENGHCEILDIGDVAIFIVDDISQSEYVFINTHRVVGYYYEYSYEGKNVASFNEMLFVESVTDVDSAQAFADAEGWTNFEIIGYVTAGDNKSIYYIDGDVNGELKDPSNTNLIDNYVPKVDDVIGTWNGKKVSNIGAILTWIQKPLNFFLVILIPLILLFGYNIFIVVKYVIDVKTENARKLALEEAKGISQEEEEEIKRKAVEEYMKKMGIDPNSSTKEESKE